MSEVCDGEWNGSSGAGARGESTPEHRDLGVNLAGAAVISDMRERIVSLQAELPLGGGAIGDGLS
jgi:hypothetical protein